MGGIDYSSLVQKHMSSFYSSTNVTTTSSGYSAPSTANQIADALLGIGSMAAMMAIASKAQAGGGPSGVQINKAAATIVSTYPAKIAQSVNTFNTNYAKCGITIDASGKTNKTFEQAKSEIESEIKKYKDSMKSADGKTNNLDAYNNAKAEYSGLKTSLDTFDSYTKTLESYQGDKDITITNFGNKGSTAKANLPNASDFEKYLSPEDKKNGVSPTTTQAYQNAKAANEQKAQAYNNVAQAQDRTLGNYADRNALSGAVDAAKGKMEELGKALAKDDGANGSTSCSQYDATLEGLQAKLQALGTKADFDAAVKEIKDMNQELADATKINTAQKGVEESNNYVKNTRNKGIFNRMFKKSSQAHKDAIAQRNQNRANLSAEQQRLAEKYGWS